MAELADLLKALAESDARIGELGRAVAEEEARRRELLRQVLAHLGGTRPPKADTRRTAKAPEVALPPPVTDVPFPGEELRTRAIVRLLYERIKPPFGARDVARALDCSRRTATKYVGEACDLGLLEFLGNGFYGFPARRPDAK